MAQATAEKESAEPSAADEIIVTAQRRSERLQDVPVSVTAVTASSLRSLGVNSLSQLNQAAPSLQVSGENNFTIRGIGTLAFQQSLEASVAIQQDEVNLVNPILAGAVGAFFDVERVEVLSGPQGMLFGKNASAGLLNIVTRRPEFGVTGGTVEVEGVVRPTAATEGLGITGRGTLNLPVTEKSALRINAVYSSQDPVVKFIGSGKGDFGQDQWGIRARFLANLTEGLWFDVIADYNREKGIATYFDRTYRTLAANADVNPLNAALGIKAGPDNLLIGGNSNFYRNAKRGGLQATLAYDLPSGIEISNTIAWKAASREQNFDTDYTNSNGADINRSQTHFNQITNELRLALPPSNRLTGQAGLFFYRGHTDVEAQLAGNNLFPSAILPNFPFCVGATVLGTAPPACTVSNSYFLGQDRNYTLVSKSYAAFGQFTYEVVDNLKIIAGARLTHDVLEIDAVQNMDRYFVTLGAARRAFTAKTVNTDFSYKLGFQYNFARDVMLYATYSRGYKGPGFADLLPATVNSPVVKPETNRNIEVGLKSTWMDGKLLINITAFRSKFKNLQVSSFNAAAAADFVQNAASATSQGLELLTVIRPAKGLTLTGSATLLDSEFNDFPGAVCYPGQVATGCPTAFNARGLRTPVSPKLVANGQIKYEWSLGDSLDAFVEGNITHRSSQWFTINQAPGTRLPAYDLLGASIGVTSKAGWRVSAFCRNCTDKRVPTGLGLDPAESVAGRIGIGQLFGFNSVRQIGVNLGIDF
ncbi:TonB-dependent receptor [Novosphingobium sp.]|uniref:TonB-dependent receptor n=1 Tax=Novosphingobium sp. TaxID=1874826 RepID=UPI001EC217D4|nr:TonB-dependent receptor [Novosphingobium sp.]MBK9011576.1 TonB-dependent receptor [Novosphingobium sp.]